MKPGVLYLLLAGILSGGIVTGGQFFLNLGFSTHETVIFGMGFAAIVLAVASIFRKEILPTRESIKLFIMFGFITAFLIYAQFGSLAFGIPVAVVVFLLYLQPLWSVVLGRVFLGEKITQVKITALFISIAGMYFLIAPEIHNFNLFGLFLATSGGLTLSIYLIFSRKAGLKKFNILSTNFGMRIFTLAFILLFYPSVSTLIPNESFSRLSFNFPTIHLLYLFIFGLFVAGIQLFIYKGFQTVEASTGGIILMLEPVAATILAYFLFGQAITTGMIIGGALILFADWLVIRESG